MYRKQRENSVIELDAWEKYYFLKAVDQIMNAVIEPVMREIIEELRSRGLKAVVVKKCQTMSESGNLQFRHISMVLSIDNRRPGNDFARYPSIGFVADSRNERILVREIRFTATGTKEIVVGEYRITELGPDLAMKHIRAFIPRGIRMASLVSERNNAGGGIR